MSQRMIWFCKIGSLSNAPLPDSADLPMRDAILKAFFEVTGRQADFIFSGWSAELTPTELSVLGYEVIYAEIEPRRVYPAG